MSNYRDPDQGWAPMGRQRPSTTLEKAVAGLAIIAGILLLVSAFAHSKGAPPFLENFDWGIAPLGLVQFGIAWTYIERAGANRSEETYSQRTLRFTALAFFLLGVVLIAVGVHDHFQGTAA